MDRVPPAQELVGRSLPDSSLPTADGEAFPLSGRPRPLVLFFYIRNGTPG